MKDTIGMKPTELNEELTERVVKQCFENGKKNPIINNGKSEVKEKILNRLNTDMLEMEECIEHFIVEDEGGYSCEEVRKK